jgi:N-acetylmuramoyl-L-alanine amidase CwlA
MKIKYIIDYKGYGNLYQLTNTRTGECLDITKEQAQDYKLSTTFFSVKAEVSLNGREEVEVKLPLGYSVR